MLSAIKSFLRKRGAASLQEISLHLLTPVEAVDGMLQTLQRKGSVRERSLKSACGSSCSNCDPATIRIFELLEGEPPNDVDRPIDTPPDRPS